MSVKKIQKTQPPSNYVQMGEQLTEQYRKVERAMVEILKFGAMLQKIREVVSTVDTTRPRGGGEDMKGKGLKAWLEEYAPEIKRPTAYRYLGIAEAIAEEYAEIVGQRVAKKYTLPELVLAEELPQQAQAKQLELFDYVSGTSQRSWLDRFRNEPAPALGGKREGAGRPQKDFNAEAELAKLEWEAWHSDLIKLMAKPNSFIHLERERLERLDADLMDLRKQIKAVTSGN